MLFSKTLIANGVSRWPLEPSLYDNFWCQQDDDRLEKLGPKDSVIFTNKAAISFVGKSFRLIVLAEEGCEGEEHVFVGGSEVRQLQVSWSLINQLLKG